MKRQLLLFAAGILTAVQLNAQSVVINKVYNNTSSALGGSVNGQGDGVELLVLEDHYDLRNAYIKDCYNMSGSSTALVEGGQFQFTNNDLWKDLRSGTTITLIRPATSTTANPIPAPALDTDASDFTLQMALTNTASAPYITQITEYNSYLFNIQGTDGIILKKGDSPLGYDNVIHFFFANFDATTALKGTIDAFPFPKMLYTGTVPGSTGTPGYSGFVYATNPSALTVPHLGISDYSGVDNIVATFIATASDSRGPSWGTGEPGNNQAFISYLRSAPRIDSIVPARAGTSNMVDFTVHFPKAVTGVDLSDFTVYQTETATGELVSVSGSGDKYTVRVRITSGSTGEGDLGIIVKGSGTGITDGTNQIFEGFSYGGKTFRVGPDKPVITATQVFGLNAGATGGTSIGTPLATLPGEGNVAGWTIISGNEDNIFSIDTQTGEITLAEGAVLDFDSKQTYILTLTAKNSTAVSDPQTVTIELINRPSAPVISGAYENQVSGLKPIISGTAKAKSMIRLYVDNIPLEANIQADAEGNWSYRFQSPLSEGYHTFYAVAVISGTSGDPGPEIRVKTISSGWVLLPHNILTPNNDGKNDTWIVEHIDVYKDNEVIVYDKQGKVVFREKNYQQDWNGTWNGQVLNTGTYYYQVNPGGGLRPLKGTLTIVRDR